MRIQVPINGVLGAIKNPRFSRSELIPFIFFIVSEIVAFCLTGAKITSIFILFIESAD